MMATQYSEWQQSVDGPDELSQEEQIMEGMAVLYATYNIGQLIDKMGFPAFEILEALDTGRASSDFVAAMNQLANEAQP